jgi:hypothetical protein
MLPSHMPRSSQWSLTFGSPNQNPVNTSPFPYACHMSCSPHPPWFNHPNNIRWIIQAVKFIIYHEDYENNNKDTRFTSQDPKPGYYEHESQVLTTTLRYLIIILPCSSIDTLQYLLYKKIS